MSEKLIFMPRAMWGTLGAIACIAIWFTLGLILWVSSCFEEDPISMSQWASFGAPVVFLILPSLFYAAKKRNFVHLPWILAAAPVLSILNEFAAIILTTVSIKLIGVNEINYSIAAFCTVIVWASLLGIFLALGKR